MRTLLQNFTIDLNHITRYFLNLKNNKLLIFVIPFIYIFWCFFNQSFYRPFFLSRIDPEYPYLLNGLNCAILEFDRIGHVDHPGTPFQIITGIFIWLTYILAGHGNIVEDVISRPELYLSMSSVYLYIISFIVLVWIGKIALKNNNFLIICLLLQGSFLIYKIVMPVSISYTPDRLLLITTFVLIALLLKLFSDKEYGYKRFAIHTGIVIGISVVTKINYIPFVILPLFLISGIRNHLIYLFSLCISAVISFLPIESKYVSFRNFILDLISHDGLYGGGNKQFINIKGFTDNLQLIFANNIALLIILGASFIILILIFIRKKDIRQNKLEFKFLISFIIISLTSLLLVAKHFKDYYILPVLIISSFALFIIWSVSKKIIPKKIVNTILITLVIFLSINVLNRIIPYFDELKLRNESNRYLYHYIENNVTKNDYFFIEPTWMSGPMIENGLIFGISYVGHRRYFYNAYEKYYPNIITWEGPDKNIRYFRMLEADIEKILKTGKKIYIFSSPGRNAGMLCDYIQHQADSFSVTVTKDTLYANHQKQEYLLCFKNADNWHIKSDILTGFENIKGDRIINEKSTRLSDDPLNLNSDFVCNGIYSCKLNPQTLNSPSFTLTDVDTGDFIETTIKIRHKNIDSKNAGSLLITGINAYNPQKKILFETDTVLSEINEEWSIIKLKASITEEPVNKSLKCYYRLKENQTIYLDDFRILHLSKN